MWVTFILISALLLALYDLAKKHSVRDNAVMPVLFTATLCGSAGFAVALAGSGGLGAALAIGSKGFWLVALKSLIVSASWVFVYYAMRALPLSIAAPIRASAPLWTLIGAIALVWVVWKNPHPALVMMAAAAAGLALALA